MQAEEIIYYIALQHIPNIGTANAKQLISYCGGAENIFKKNKQKLLKIPGVGPTIVDAVKNADLNSIFKKAESEYEFCIEKDIKILSYNNALYPQRLKHCKDAPYLLFMLGEIDLNPKKAISIVGTRRSTHYGKEVTYKIVEELKNLNISIISGLAYGIDAHAHKAALNHNLPTAGVLAHGLDMIYPAAHRKLANEIVRNHGGLVTEFTSGRKPDRQNFPSRNRIVAGITDATIVIESAEKGGALITADIAQSYNKDVFAVPGKVSDKYSKGCNQLIKNNVAALVESGQDIIDWMGWNEDKNDIAKHKQTSLFIELSAEEQKIYDCLQEHNKSIHIDFLKQKIDTSNGKLKSNLLQLELKGAISSKPGNTYELL